jgi:hypothetical protein
MGRLVEGKCVGAHGRMGRMKKGVKIPFCCPGNLWPVWGGQTRV